MQLPQVGSCDHVILCELLTPSVTCGHTYVKDFTNTVLLFEVVMLTSIESAGRATGRVVCVQTCERSHIIVSVTAEY